MTSNRTLLYQGAIGAAAAALLPLATPARAQERRIPLTPAMVLNESAVGDATLLVDEQATVSDPAAAAGGKGGTPLSPPRNPFFPGWTAWRYPVSVFLDLGIRYRVTRLFLYNETGEHPLVVSTGKPFAWQPKPITLGGYRQWQEVPLGVETRYLRLTLTAPASLPEIVAYGEPLEKAAAVAAVRKTAPARAARPTMDQFIGTNAFIDDPVPTIAGAAGFVREYHSWSWDVEGKDGLRRFQPSGAAGGNAWFFDDYYARLKARGVTVAPCIQQSVAGLFGANKGSDKPIPSGADAEDPAAYARHAAHLFQYAARYGSRKVDDRLLELAPGQPRVSGQNLLRYLENWNEPDATWIGREGYFTPYELAAMCSADYDGHKGALGKGYGVKAADPTLRLAMGGLAGPSLDYLQAMKVWADAHRGPGDFPADAINLHHYSGNGENQQFGTQGVSPEQDRLREKMAAFTAWRDAHLPDRELWVTEFGYDVDPRSPLHAPTIGKLSAEAVQAAWIVRSYLALAAAGVDRAAQFMLRDVKTVGGGGGVFETSGLVTEKGQWTPRLSYYAVATLRNRLTGMRFAAEVPTGREDVRVYRFEAAASGAVMRAAYAVWCPTSEDRRIASFRLPLTGAKRATRVDFARGKTAGEAAPLAVRDGAVTLAVGETPTLILIDR